MGLDGAFLLSIMSSSSPVACKLLIGILVVFGVHADPRGGSPTGHAASAKSTADLYTIHRNIDESQVAFTVRDRHGNPISGLSERQFQLLQDGQPVTNVTSFSRQEGVALRLMLMLDSSESMRKGFGAEQRMAQSLLVRLLRPEVDRVSVLSFAASSRAMTGESPRVVSTSIRQLKAEGQTAFYDALYEGVGNMTAQSSVRPERRVIIAFSDGEDNWSRHTVDEVILRAQQAEVAIFSITAHSARLEYAGDRVLHRLAEATGGRAFVLKRYDKLDKVLAEIETELRANYVLGFRPSPAAQEPGYHTLKIIPQNRRWTVRSRTGYYVPLQ